MTTAVQPETINGSTWQIDAAHSSVEFSVKHLMIATVKGRFGQVAGTIAVDDSGAASVDVTVDAASINTHSDQRDGHLRSPDFFDVDRFPTVRFVSRGVKGGLTGRFALVGDLTIRGITRQVTLDVQAEGLARDPWGGERAVFGATTLIRRSDFGLNYNQALETGGVLVGEDVKLQIEVELVRQ